MKKLTVIFPKVPERSQTEDMLSALGRLVLAWSAAEFELALLLSRLMATPDLSTVKSVDEETGAANATAIVDANAVFAIYFAIDSNRGRREVLTSLLNARVEEEIIDKAWAERITSLLEEHRKLASQRNRYIHTAMGSTEENPFVLLDKRLFIQPKTRKQNLKALIGQVKVNAGQINEVSDRLADWISRFEKIRLNLPTAISPDQPRPAGS